VYLPAGTWYDFWTGSTSTGGAKVNASAPLSQIPLYVRAGSIVPLGPKIQYATESADPLELRIYEGHDATFTLSEDAGDGYDYELGQYSEIAFTWNDTARTLTIAGRTGSYAGMLQSRTFNVVWVGSNHGAGIDATTADKVVSYDGSPVTVSAP
jgi:alpha-D-xyloside xylohydrolase